MNFCKDCKHYVSKSLQVNGNDIDRYAECARWPSKGFDLVSGTPLKADTEYCGNERQKGWWGARRDNICGKEGRFWEKANAEATDKTSSEGTEQMNKVNP